MNSPVSNELKARPVIGTFMTYIHNSGTHKGRLVAVDFKVKGKQIQYTYTTLKKRTH